MVFERDCITIIFRLHASVLRVYVYVDCFSFALYVGDGVILR